MKMIKPVCLLLSCTLMFGSMLVGCNPRLSASSTESNIVNGNSTISNGSSNPESRFTTTQGSQSDTESSSIENMVSGTGSSVTSSKQNNNGTSNHSEFSSALTSLSTSSTSSTPSSSSTSSSTSSSKPDDKDYGDVKAQFYSPSVTANMSGVLTVDANTIINKSIIGGGVNFDYSSYVFMNIDNGNEWGGIRSQQIPYFPGHDKAIEDGLWDEYFKMIDFNGMQYIRLNISFLMWEPINDNNDPFNTDFDKGFTFSPNFSKRADAKNVPKNTFLYMQKFYTLLDYFEKKGLYVILGNWDIGSQSTGFCPNNDNWMAKKKADGTRYGRGDEIFVNSLDEYAETFAAIMYHLKVEKKYNCIKGFSFYNEPEGLKNYEDTLTQVYNKFGQHLTRLGIRDKVLIQAYDGPIFWNAGKGEVNDQITRMLPKCGNNMDVISIHNYVSTIEAGPQTPETQGTISQSLINRFVKPAIAQSQGRPVVLGELGTFAYRTSEGDYSPKDFRLKIFDAEATVQAFNAGAKATGFWIYNCYLHKYFTMLDFDKDNMYRMIPDDINYYPTALTIKYLPGGTNIIKSTLTGCKISNTQRVFATVGKKGTDTTVLLVNDSNDPAKVTIKGIDTSKKYIYHYVTKGQTDRIYPGGTVDFSSCNTIAIRPQSIVVLTTYTYGTQTVRF